MEEDQTPFPEAQAAGADSPPQQQDVPPQQNPPNSDVATWERSLLWVSHVTDVTFTRQTNTALQYPRILAVLSV